MTTLTNALMDSRYLGPRAQVVFLTLLRMNYTMRFELFSLPCITC